jgi:ferredoxin-NADP reductase
MATPRFAQVVAVTVPVAGTRVLDLAASEPLGFVGGQYLIVDTGLVLPTGKAVKRAYSILSADADQQRFRLAIQRIPAGAGSAYMHQAAPGATLKFSGPWGKMLPGADQGGETLVLATDTGITAALGLLQSARFRPLLGQTHFFWLRTAPGAFLPDALVRPLVPPELAASNFGLLPPIDHPERIPWVRGLVRPYLGRGRIARAFIAGDGAVNYALLDDLVAAGVPATRDSVESFFNMPKKAAA